MSDHFLDVTQPLDPTQRKLKITDNGDGTYSISASVTSNSIRALYDYINLDPPAQPTTITYRNGGPSGTIVATTTITYSGTDIASVYTTYP